MTKSSYSNWQKNNIDDEKIVKLIFASFKKK